MTFGGGISIVAPEILTHGGMLVANLMFRSKADNHFYAEAKKPSGAGTWYVFYYDLRGKKVRQRIGANKRTASLAKGEIEARL